MHRRLPRLWLLFLGLGLLGALLLVRLRMVGVRAAFGDYMGCTNCLDHAVLLSDLRPLALLVVLLAAAWLSRRRWWRLPLMLAAVTIVTLYAIDQGIFLIFGFRLKVSDLFRYGGDTSAAWSVVMPVAMTPRGVLLLAGWALGCLGWCGAIVRAGRAIGMAAAGTAAAAGMAGETCGWFMRLPSFCDEHISPTPGYRQAFHGKSPFPMGRNKAHPPAEND